MLSLLPLLPLLGPPAVAKTTYMVPMSDGTELATDVHFPRFGRGPWPVLLMRTPYNKNVDLVPLIWLPFGYAVVIQDTRGCFASQGLDRVFIDDAWGAPAPPSGGAPLPPQRDGYDTARWVLRQDWCNGSLGTTGESATGITQNLLAGVADNGVDCQIIVVAATDHYRQAIYQGGAFREALVVEWLHEQGSDYMLDYYEQHPRYDPVWQWANVENRSALIEQPGYHMGGWYDIFSQGTLHAFQQRQEQGGEGARGNQKLIIGPWTHEIGLPDVGELHYPDALLFSTPWSIVGSEADWYAHWLKGVANGIMEKPAVAYYQMGPTDQSGPWNEWRAAASWPPPAEPVELYLRGDGGLGTRLPPPDGEPRDYLFDPEDPVPTIGGANLNIEMGPMDQSAVEQRADVLTYRTLPLPSAVETAGAVRVDLWVSSDALDTDFTAKLIDQYPDGRNMLVCDGILRARYRESFESERLLTPGELVPLTIDLWSTAITFGPGHRIGVDISSSNYPRFDVNPNTGEPVRRHTHMVTARNSIYHDAEHRSRLTLQVVGGVEGWAE
jgi:predicted acyl esterase